MYYKSILIDTGMLDLMAVLPYALLSLSSDEMNATFYVKNSTSAFITRIINYQDYKPTIFIIKPSGHRFAKTPPK